MWDVQDCMNMAPYAGPVPGGGAWRQRGVVRALPSGVGTGTAAFSRAQPPSSRGPRQRGKKPLPSPARLHYNPAGGAQHRQR